MTDGWKTSDWKTIDYFADQSLVEDPYPYFEQLRSACPVLQLPHLGVVAVTGYDEAMEVYHDVDTFSSCNSVIGPFVTFPVPLEGDDVGDIIDRHRDQLPMNEHMVTMDPPMHTQERALLMRLITPKRLKDNEAFMWRLADQQLDEFVVRRPLRVHQRVRTALRDARRRRSARSAGSGSPTVPRVLRPEPQSRRGRRGRAGGRRAQPARGARRLVRGVHRGPAACAGQRRVDRSRAGDVPRRHHARGRRRGAYGDVPVRRRSGDDRAPARGRVAAARRTTRAPGRAADEPRAHPGLPRGGAPRREPGEDRLPAHPAGARRSAASTSRRARR